MTKKMKPLKKDVEAAIEELKLAMLESIAIDEADKNIKQAKTKNHYRLNKAREEVRSLQLDY